MILLARRCRSLATAGLTPLLTEKIPNPDGAGLNEFLIYFN